MDNLNYAIENLELQIKKSVDEQDKKKLIKQLDKLWKERDDFIQASMFNEDGDCCDEDWGV